MTVAKSPKPNRPPLRFTPEQLAIIARGRNEGLGISGTVAVLRESLPDVSHHDVSAAIKAGLPRLVPKRPVRTHQDKAVVLVVPRKVLDERRERLGMPPRNLTAALMGDPPPGYSALDCGSKESAHG
jgi:hypothetical protein